MAIALAAVVAGVFVAPWLFGNGSPGAGAGRSASIGSPHNFSLSAARAGARSRHSSVIARAKRRSVAIYHSRSSTSPYRRIRARTLSGRRLPLVFLVKGRRHGWVKAYLPTRPNLSAAYIRARDVSLATDDYRVEVQLRRHRLVVHEGRRTIMRERIAVGKSLSPTPTGRYFITDLIRPPGAHGFYGPYAFGLSAHSRVFTTFEGGDGQVGIHGTNNPAAIGHDVSHGCIRVRNRTITRLAKTLPLGTPVVIEH